MPAPCATAAVLRTVVVYVLLPRSLVQGVQCCACALCRPALGLQKGCRNIPMSNCKKVVLPVLVGS